jgi:hypothetical protein
VLERREPLPGNVLSGDWDPYVFQGLPFRFDFTT